MWSNCSGCVAKSEAKGVVKKAAFTAYPRQLLHCYILTNIRCVSPNVLVNID
jgi:hypothetical protein